MIHDNAKLQIWVTRYKHHYYTIQVTASMDAVLYKRSFIYQHVGQCMYEHPPRDRDLVTLHSGARDPRIL